MDTFGMRKTAHIFGMVTLEARPWFLHQFAPVFNGSTFLDFLKEIVRRSRRKVFLVTITARATTSTSVRKRAGRRDQRPNRIEQAA
jgi:hypothetical protein